MTSAPLHRPRILAVAAVLIAAVGVVLGVGVAPVSAADNATVYLVQGLPDRTVDLAIDGKVVARDVAGATLSSPIAVQAGERTLTFTSEGATVLERTMKVAAGDSTDIVLHLPVDPQAAPVVTLFDNSTAAVPSGKAALTVAHTASVPPADIRVDGKVLFANIANGEALNLVVPGGTYKVDIVPTGKTSPVVLGPIDLDVTSGSLNRVFAVGDPNSDDMRVVVQQLRAETAGSAVPGRVDSGTGGQASGQSALAILPRLR